MLRLASTLMALDKFDEALTGVLPLQHTTPLILTAYQSVVTVDPRNSEALLQCGVRAMHITIVSRHHASQRLPALIDEQREKLKTEMLGLCLTIVKTTHVRSQAEGLWQHVPEAVRAVDGQL